jgi:hypothetical protein
MPRLVQLNQGMRTYKSGSAGYKNIHELLILLNTDQSNYAAKLQHFSDICKRKIQKSDGKRQKTRFFIKKVRVRLRM